MVVRRDSDMPDCGQGSRGQTQGLNWSNSMVPRTLVKFYLERRRAKRTGIRSLMRLVMIGGAV